MECIQAIAILHHKCTKLISARNLRYLQVKSVCESASFFDSCKNSLWIKSKFDCLLLILLSLPLFQFFQLDFNHIRILNSSSLYDLHHNPVVSVAPADHISPSQGGQWFPRVHLLYLLEHHCKDLKQRTLIQFCQPISFDTIKLQRFYSYAQ